jgi:hypothetical protein
MEGVLLQDVFCLQGGGQTGLPDLEKGCVSPF